MKLRLCLSPDLRARLHTNPVHYDRDAASVFAYRTEDRDSWIMITGFYARYPSFVSMGTPYAFCYELTKE